MARRRKGGKGDAQAPQVTLYAVVLSHPSISTKLALALKGIDYELRNLTPGLHAASLRARGFPAGTVPALVLDGEKVQGSREITRALDEYQPEPRLFPADPSLRVAVEDAERWGEESLQPVPRRLYRYLVSTDSELRAGVARSVGLPAPKLAARLTGPLSKGMAEKEDANADQVRLDMAALPGMVRRIEQLMADGVIAGDQPNAADFQIAPTIRVLLELEDTAPAVAGTPLEQWARDLVPDYPGHLPAKLPPEWTEAIREAAAARSAG